MNQKEPIPFHDHQSDRSVGDPFEHILRGLPLDPTVREIEREGAEAIRAFRDLGTNNN